MKLFDFSHEIADAILYHRTKKIDDFYTIERENESAEEEIYRFFQSSGEYWEIIDIRLYKSKIDYWSLFNYTNSSIAFSVIDKCHSITEIEEILYDPICFSYMSSDQRLVNKYLEKNEILMIKTLFSNGLNSIFDIEIEEDYDPSAIAYCGD